MTNYSKKYFEDRDVLITHLAMLIKNIMTQNNYKSVLDVGCGTGRLVAYLNKHKFRAFGCDISNEAVKAAQNRNKNGSIVKASALDLPFKQKSFDMVVAISLIEHLTPSQVNQFIKQVKKVLKGNGSVFIVTPNYSTPFRYIQGKRWFGYQDPTHINFFSPSSLNQILIKHGFSEIKFLHKLPYASISDREFPYTFTKLPKLIKKILVYSFFLTPVAYLRNSLWVMASKK